MGAYATLEEYRLDSGDEATPDARVAAVLEAQSAKLRLKLGIEADRKLTADQEALARLLVTDAARKALVAPTVEGVEDMAGVQSTSFSANGFSGSVTLANPSGTAYFDRDALGALKRSLSGAQRIGAILPRYGGSR